MNAPLRTIIRWLRKIKHRNPNVNQHLLQDLLDRDYNAGKHHRALDTLLWYMYGL